ITGMDRHSVNQTSFEDMPCRCGDLFLIHLEAVHMPTEFSSRSCQMERRKAVTNTDFTDRHAAAKAYELREYDRFITRNLKVVVPLIAQPIDLINYSTHLRIEHN